MLHVDFTFKGFNLYEVHIKFFPYEFNVERIPVFSGFFSDYSKNIEIYIDTFFFWVTFFYEIEDDQNNFEC